MKGLINSLHLHGHCDSGEQSRVFKWGDMTREIRAFRAGYEARCFLFREWLFRSAALGMEEKSQSLNWCWLQEPKLVVFREGVDLPQQTVALGPDPTVDAGTGRLTGAGAHRFSLLWGAHLATSAGSLSLFSQGTFPWADLGSW